MAKSEIVNNTRWRESPRLKYNAAEQNVSQAATVA